MQIDNMEGLAIHREGRDIVLTMMSDDNFNGIPAHAAAGIRPCRLTVRRAAAQAAA